MFAIIGLILFIIAWFEHGSRATGVPAWFDWQSLALLGLAALAAHLFWPLWRRPPAS
jgi:hypothetical protein